MTFVDPSSFSNPADVSAAMVAPRPSAIGNFTKWQTAYAGGTLIPKLSLGATMHRGAQTVLRGGYAESPTFDITRGMSTEGKFLKPSTWSSMIKRQTYGSRQMVTKFPKSYTRYDSTSIFNSSHTEKVWDPWQLSDMANPVLRKMPGMAGQDALTRGTSSMVSASSTMFRMGEAEQLSTTMRSSVAATIRATNPTYANALGMGGYSMEGGSDAAYALLGANSGMISGRAAGMYAGAKAGLSGGEVSEQILGAARATSLGGARFASAAERAQTIGAGVRDAGGVLKYAGLAGEAGESAGAAMLRGGGVKAAGLAGDLLPGIGEVSMALQAFMLAKGAAHLLRGTVQNSIKTVEDGIKSFKGSIDKPVFGMGFRDTEASMTARSRGVQAIQNSQLNARSWLGSEGGAMWSHFG